MKKFINLLFMTFIIICIKSIQFLILKLLKIYFFFLGKKTEKEVKP